MRAWAFTFQVKSLSFLRLARPMLSTDASPAALKCSTLCANSHGVTQCLTASTPNDEFLNHPQLHSTSKVSPSILSRLPSSLITDIATGSWHRLHRNRSKCEYLACMAAPQHSHRRKIFSNLKTA